MEIASFVWFIIGLGLIIKGSDWFVEGAVWIARALKVSDIMIGATLVSICTTLPEAMVSTSSALRGNTDMAMGNVLGSIAFNSGIILGIVILFTEPRIKGGKGIKTHSKLLVALLAGLFILGVTLGTLSRISGFLLLTGLAFYLWRNVKAARDIQKEERETSSIEERTPDKKEKFRAVVIFAVGLIMTVFGADLLVEHGEVIARTIGVPDLVIGLTMTSVGTSLPELVTAISAIRKKAQDLSVGNIIGANLLNVLLVIGIVSSLEPVNLAGNLLYFHFPVAIFITGMTALFISSRKKQMMRSRGYLLVTVYTLYLVAILLQN